MSFRDMGVSAEKLTLVTEPARAYFRKAVPAGGYRAFLVETEDGRVIAGGGVLIIHWPASQWDARALAEVWSQQEGPFLNGPVKYLLLTPADIYVDDCNFVFSVSFS